MTPNHEPDALRAQAPPYAPPPETQRLIDERYREELREARAMTPEQKLLRGARPNTPMRLTHRILNTVQLASGLIFLAANGTDAADPILLKVDARDVSRRVLLPRSRFRPSPVHSRSSIPSGYPASTAPPVPSPTSPASR